MKKPPPINKTVIIDTDTKRDFIMRFIADLPLEPLMGVRVYEHKETRSVAQNKLMWRWLTHIAGGGEIFSTKEDCHEYYKETFLVHIFERDDPEYAAMIDAVRSVHKAGMKMEAVSLKKKIVKLTSTTDANVSQMTEYLKEIENDCNNRLIELPRREDEYYKAFGIRR